MQLCWIPPILSPKAPRCASKMAPSRDDHSKFMKTLTLIMTIIASEMIASAQNPGSLPPSSVTRAVTIQHVTVTSHRDFAATIREFEKQIGRFDPEAHHAIGEPNPQIDQIKAKIEAMAGSSGFMRFGEIHKFGELVILAGQPAGKANQYVIGNSLIALQMVKHQFSAGLYVPLRILISEDASGVTHVEYDLPSSLMGQFGDPEVDKVARMLDNKLNALITSSANP
jgi:hypothetical protein